MQTRIGALHEKLSFWGFYSYSWDLWLSRMDKRRIFQEELAAIVKMTEKAGNKLQLIGRRGVISRACPGSYSRVRPTDGTTQVYSEVGL